MRRLASPFLLLLPVPLIIWACDGQTTVQPDLEAELGVTVAAKSSMAAGVPKMVPFKMKGTWWAGSSPDPAVCQDFPGASMPNPTWVGTATHMGLVEGAVTNCSVQQPDGSFILYVQSGEIVAANGDRLFAHGTAAEDGVQLIVHPDLSFEIFDVPFVGGTGRFENATGYYHLYGNSLGGGDFTAVGMISSVGSSK